MSAEADQEERDLATAIALSLQQDVPKASISAATAKRKHEVISLDSDSETEEDEPDPAPKASTSSSVLNRAEMERERLERVKAKELAGVDLRPSKIRARDSSKDQQQRFASLSTSESSAQPTSPAVSTSQQQPVYLEPVTKHVFNMYHPNDPNAITFQSILGPVRFITTLCPFQGNTVLN